MPGPVGGNVTPIHVTINGKSYLVNKYRQLAVPSVARQGDIAGGASDTRDARPETLTWELTDWSMGEGVQVFDATNPSHKRKYRLSSNPVDISTPGQLKLGRATVETFPAAASTVTAGPFLESAGGNVWLAYEGNLREQTALDTWTVRTSGTTRIKGMTSVAGFVYYGGHNEVIRRRSATAGPTAITSENGHAPLVSNSELYGMNFASATGTITLYSWVLDESYPNTGTSRGTIQLGLQSLSVVSPPVSYGPNVFFVVQPSSDSAYLYVYDGDALVERKKFPNGFRVHDAGLHPTRNTAVLNDGIFVAGYYEGVPEIGSVEYVLARGESGSLGSLREEEGTTLRAVGCVNTRGNELLIGTNAGKIFRYDMGTGGKSLFADIGGSGRVIFDMVYVGGRYYFAWRDGGSPNNIGVFRTRLAADSGDTYVSTSTVTHPVWHFGYPAQKKIVFEVELQVKTMPAGTSIEFNLLVDDTTLVTTDINGNPLTITAAEAVTRKTFVLNATGRFFEPRLIPSTTSGDNTPTLLNCSIRAESQSKLSYYELELDLRDHTPTRRPPDRQVTGRVQAAELEALYNAGGTFSMKPHFRGAPPPHPKEDTAVTVLFVNEEGIANLPFELEMAAQGQGTAKLLLRKVSG